MMSQLVMAMADGDSGDGDDGGGDGGEVDGDGQVLVLQRGDDTAW